MANSRKPNLFIAGAPKCGTSALYTYLKQHPQIFMSPRKEPHYFGADFNKRPLNTYGHIADEATYLKLFSAAKNEKFLGEASTTYFFSTHAAQEIYDFNPDAKIIIMLRSPAEMMYSLYYQHRETGHETLPTFEQALAAEPARRKGEQLADRVYIPESVCYRYIARYPEHLVRYFLVFGRDNVHIIVFDDFKAGVKSVYDKTLAFLGVENDQRTQFEIVNPNSQPRSLFLRDYLVNPPGIVLKLGQRMLPVARPVYRLLRSLNTQKSTRPPMQETTLIQLKQDLLPEVETLSQMLDRDLTHWCRVGDPV